MKYLLILLVIFISCDKKHELLYGNGIYYLKDMNFEISDLRQIDWSVGRKRDKEVSQGFSFEIEIPKLSSSNVETLRKKYGIDSWVFRIIKDTRKQNQEIGYIQYDFNNFTSTVDSFSAKILYHAASVSMDFRRFHCPAFDHRFMIKDLELKDSNSRNKILYTTSDDFIRRKISKPSFSILSFSGGRSLKAKFLVEVAFFNSKTKKTYGEFVSSSNIIEVDEEESVALPSCIGIKEEVTPLPESRAPGLRDLEIK